MAKRKIIKIDKTKCDGCGLCIPNCREGAIQIIDGKARLVSDIFCDGLGACLGHCPKGAITIEEREAEAFDEKEVAKHTTHKHSGCPGSKAMSLGDKSKLSNWPVQIMLVPTDASYFKGADLLIAADCVPFAYADFHEDLLRDKILLVGCPKLDDIELYRQKIGEIIKRNNINSVTYAHMEVPCCFGLIAVIKEAITDAGKKIPFKEVVISIQGERIK